MQPSDNIRVLKQGAICSCIFIVMMIFTLYWFSVCHSSRFLLVFSLLSVVVTVFIFLSAFLKHRYELDWSYQIALLLLGFLFIGLFTPGSVPDETLHFWSSYATADLISGKKVDFANAKIEVRSTDVKLDLEQYCALSKASLNRVASQAKLFNSSGHWTIHNVPSGSMDLVQSPIYLRLFPALGILLAQIFGLGSFALFYAGRLFNFMLFFVLASLAIRITPAGRTGFKVISLLPMTMHVVSSYSYDSGIIGLAMLLSALMLRLIYGDRENQKAYLIALPICAALLAPCKIVYVFLVGAILLVPADKFISRKFEISYKAGVLLCGVASIALLRLPTLISMSGVGGVSSNVSYRGTESGTFYHLSNIFQDPLGTAALFVRTFDQKGDFYISGVVGGSLGWFQANIVAPCFLTFFYLVVLLLSFVQSSEDKLVLSGKVRVTLFALCMISCVSIMLSMYLGWTFDTEPVIQGVQGRYFIPVLPFLLLSLRSRKLWYSGFPSKSLVCVLVTVNCVYLMRIVSLALVS